MKLLHKAKDGGSESTVTGYWLIEWKQVFSIVLLKFEGKSREVFHTHAFNSISWLLKGCLVELFLSGDIRKHIPSLKPIITKREDFHQVSSDGTSWVLSFRGAWVDKWKEYTQETNVYYLSSGRVKTLNE